MKLANRIAATFGANRWLHWAACHADLHAVDLLCEMGDTTGAESALSRLMSENNPSALQQFLAKYATILNDKSLSEFATMEDGRVLEIRGGYRNDAPEGWVETEHWVHVDYSTVRSVAQTELVSRNSKRDQRAMV